MRAKKLLSLLLVFAMAVSLLPGYAFATEDPAFTGTGADSGTISNLEASKDYVWRVVNGTSVLASSTATVKSNSGKELDISSGLVAGTLQVLQSSTNSPTESAWSSATSFDITQAVKPVAQDAKSPATPLTVEGGITGHLGTLAVSDANQFSIDNGEHWTIGSNSNEITGSDKEDVTVLVRGKPGTDTLASESVTYTVWGPRTVILNANGGKFGSKPTKVLEVKYGANISKNDLTGAANNPTAPAGYQLDDPTDGNEWTDWYTTPTCDAGTKFDFDNTTITDETTTLYAHWTEILYNVVFKENVSGGTGADAEQQIGSITPTALLSYKNAAKYDTPAWTLPDGRAFKGWTTDEPGKATPLYTDGQEIVVTEDDLVDTDGDKVPDAFVLYAQYTDAVFNYVFDANNETANVTGTMKAGGKLDKAVPANLTNGDLHLCGWKAYDYKVYTENSGKLEKVNLDADYLDKAGFVDFDKFEINRDIVFVAQWGYRIDFVADGAEGESKDEYAEPGTIYSLPSINKAGFSEPDGKAFAGWKVNNEGEPRDPGYKIEINSDVTLYAQWKDGYTIKYVSNLTDNKTSYNVNKDYGTKSEVSGDDHTVLSLADACGGKKLASKEDEYAFPDQTVIEKYKETHHFNSWNTKQDGTGTKYEEGDTIKKVTSNITLYAQWDKTCKIEFAHVSNAETGMDTILQAPISINNGNALSRKTGEWFYLPDLNEATTDAGTNTIAVTGAGDTAIKDNYIFIGWKENNSDDLLLPGDKYTVKDDATLYAQYSIECTVTYDPNGGSGVMVDANGKTLTPAADGAYTVKVGTGDYTVLDGSFTKKGHIFDGWKVENKGTKVYYAGDTINLSGNVTLYAQWSEFKTLTFDLKGGTIDKKTGTLEVRVPTGSTAEKYMPADPVKENNTFAGWYHQVYDQTLKKNVEAVFNPTAKVNSDDATIFAKWDPAYTVRFNANKGGTGIMEDDKGHALNEKYVLPENGFTPVEGATFLGWKVNNERDVLQPKAEITITGNVTLYAQWEMNITTYAINLTKGTAKVDGEVVTEAAEKAVVTIVADKAEEGMKFSKWVCEDKDVVFEDETSETTKFTMPAKAVTIEAKYEETAVGAYTITMATEGTTADHKTANGGVKVTITATVPEGKTFDKWTCGEGENVIFDDATKATTAFTMPANNVTITANFKDAGDKDQTAMPENVKATLNVKKGTVTITWDAVEGATKYSVWRKAKGGEWSKIDKVSTTSYTDKDQLNADTKYYYCVKAQAPGLTASKHSEVTTASRIIMPKAAMTGVSAAVANGKITVSWTDNGAKYFTVYRYTKDGGWVRLPAAKKLAAGTTSFVDETAVAGTAYKYCVKSYNGTWSLKSNNTKAVKLTATTSMFAY